ncbi:MAG TPA: acetyl-CoA carboxylase carboxyltransferase subunit alpha [Thermodesulfobacteriota bacterium]|nr:acetyl-CoA carboxylase carboxyltransferase subunit alpha [Thermodesulfobacteriota bacterium]
MTRKYLDFEKPIEQLDLRVEELKLASPEGAVLYAAELRRIERKTDDLIKHIYANLTPWQITQTARHPGRPYTLDYTQRVFDEFVELHGDRLYKDDPAIVGGLGRIDNTPVVFIGHQKGRNTKERVFRNYGMPHPEGYRKALRLMELAERFKRPVVTFIDTPGAAPDIEAEERGQAEAIARNLLTMARLRVPIVSVVIGEGGSGGALAIAVADRILMLEYSTYSVISPEGCAAILWKDGTKAPLAAKALKMNSKELLGKGIVDGIVKEPLGGAHRDYDAAARTLKDAILNALNDLSGYPPDKLVSLRYEKFRKMGVFRERYS